MFVDGGVLCQLRMKGRGHDVFALDQRWFSRVFCKNLYARPGALNHRPPNKHHFERLFLERGGGAHHVARDLPAVGIPHHGHIHQLQRILPGMLHVFRQQNRRRARAKDGSSALRKFHNLFGQPLFLQKFQLGGAFAPGQNQPVATFQVAGRAHLGRLRAELLEHRGMRLKISLHRQNSDLHLARPVINGLEPLRGQGVHQPRVDSRSFSSSCRTSSPRMASPSSSCASSTAFGSSKCVVAFTTALARASGSLDLKIPDPTKTASAPSRLTSAASAGVAIPPAEKFGTGSLPVFAICRISSKGAPNSFASCINSSSRMVVSFFIWLTIARMCRTASTTLPEPASPFVRIIAAPSAMRRSASPRLRAPQTNGTR